MAEHPILFSGEMIRAILDGSGSKTQTRRVVVKARFPDGSWADAIYPAAESGWIAWQGAFQPGPHLAEFTIQQYRIGWPCPYGVPGNLLWVRETWGTVNTYDHLPPSQIPKGSRNWPQVWYGADPGAGGLGQTTCEFVGKVRFSIHMPRWASRITLEIISVRVERVQEISEADICAELGIPVEWSGDGPEPYHRSLRQAFHDRWEALNARRGYTWSNNPWVWVIEFKLSDS